MKQVIHRKLTAKILHLGFVLLFTFSTSLFAQEGDPVKGKSLYNTNCAACHKLDGKMTGPALRNVEQRLSDEQGLDRAWLVAWIRNSSGVIKSGDAYGNKIYNEYNKSLMTPFPQLSDQDISDSLAYTAAEAPGPPPVPGPDSGNNGGEGKGGFSNELILGALALLFGLLAAALVIVNKTLRRFAEAKGIEVETKPKGTPLWKAFVQNQFLVLVTVILFLLVSAYFIFGYL